MTCLLGTHPQWSLDSTGIASTGINRHRINQHQLTRRLHLSPWHIHVSPSSRTTCERHSRQTLQSRHLAGQKSPCRTSRPQDTRMHPWGPGCPHKDTRSSPQCTDWWMNGRSQAEGRSEWPDGLARRTWETLPCRPGSRWIQQRCWWTWLLKRVRENEGERECDGEQECDGE